MYNYWLATPLSNNFYPERSDDDHTHSHSHDHDHSHDEAHGHSHGAEMMVGMNVLNGILAFMCIELFIRHAKGI